jgi:hypothetical protein
MGFRSPYKKGTEQLFASGRHSSDTIGHCAVSELRLRFQSFCLRCSLLMVAFPNSKWRGVDQRAARDGFEVRKPDARN